MRRPTSRPLLPFLAGLLIGGVAVSILLQRPETERDTQKLQVQLSSAMRGHPQVDYNNLTPTNRGKHLTSAF